MVAENASYRQVEVLEGRVSAAEKSISEIEGQARADNERLKSAHRRLDGVDLAQKDITKEVKDMATKIEERDREQDRRANKQTMYIVTLVTALGALMKYLG